MAYRIVIFGAPGAGKGTQSELLVEEFGIPHVSTGDMFRRAMREGSSLGVRAQKFIDKGMLVPDEVVIQMVRERLEESDCDSGFLLDGFPRTDDQARMLTKMLDDLSTPLSAVVDIEVPRDVLKRRLAGRRLCPRCNTSYQVDSLNGSESCPKDNSSLVRRNDDSDKAVDVRLDLFDTQTKQLKNYYLEKDLLVKIDGNRAPAVVFQEIRKKIEEKLASRELRNQYVSDKSPLS